MQSVVIQWLKFILHKGPINLSDYLTSNKAVFYNRRLNRFQDWYGVAGFSAKHHKYIGSRKTNIKEICVICHLVENSPRKPCATHCRAADVTPGPGTGLLSRTTGLTREFAGFSARIVLGKLLDLCENFQKNFNN